MELLSYIGQDSQSTWRFKLSEIEEATRKFDRSLIIGKGSFGKVYKGITTVGEKQLDVAIKRLESNSTRGDVDFQIEIDMLSKLKHPNLVSLIGYCTDEDERIIVYEYMPKGNLADCLFKDPIVPSFALRLKLCIGVARGLDYLHTGGGAYGYGVIHRDLKPANILLDNNWVAKIADFGLSKICPVNEPLIHVKPKATLKGTCGYIDPEYYRTGRLTKKSDVYAFGVILLEVLCGRKALDFSLNEEEQWNLATWVQDSTKEGRLKQMVDSNLEGNISSRCLKMFARLAKRCLYINRKRRPTMAEVVKDLESMLALHEEKKKTIGAKLTECVFGSKRENSKVYLHTVGGESVILRRFDFNTITAATDNFSEANKLTKVDFVTTMYKGKLQSGQDITIYGPYSVAQHELYKNEVSILLKLKHENLVKLAGYCIDGTNMYLLYDFAFYDTLDHLIFDRNRAPLNWDERFKIILGVARVLAYLHKDAPVRVVHLNVKTCNILLDASFDPKLFGFHLAMPLAMNESYGINMGELCETNVCISDRGYLTPEGKLSPTRRARALISTKCDVFSFGVLVLETITGRKRMDTELLLEEYVRRNWLEGSFSNIIDRGLNPDSSILQGVVMLGLKCTETDAGDKPTMAEVVDLLLRVSSSDILVSEIRAMKARKWNTRVKTTKMSQFVINDNDISEVKELIPN